MKTLKEYLREAEAKKTAIGHFNISDLAGLKAIAETAKELNLPVIIGLSEGEREFVGVKEAVALVLALREEGLPIFLNADHTHSLEKIEEATRAGFDAVLFDGSKLSFEENLAQTKKAVELARSINPDVFVEGELGYIGSASAILKETPEGAALTPESFTKPEEAARFVKETGIDAFAPAVGNMHGLLESMVTGEVKKRLDIPLIGEIKQATGAFIVLHGGSGTEDGDFVAAIRMGVNIVHINTEIRLAWRRGLEAELKSKPEEVAPYKLLPGAVSRVKEVVKNRLELFSGGK
jgi:fructose-bisphosphate aldolase class II